MLFKPRKKEFKKAWELKIFTEEQNLILAVADSMDEETRGKALFQSLDNLPNFDKSLDTRNKFENLLKTTYFKNTDSLGNICVPYAYNTSLFKDQISNTALHKAANYGSKIIVKCILVTSFGVNAEDPYRFVSSVVNQIQSKNKWQKSAFDLAKENNEEEVVNLLKSIIDFASEHKEDNAAISQYIQDQCPWDESLEVMGALAAGGADA